MKKLSSNKGFTLVELIIVIAILAIIMLIAIPNVPKIIQRNKVKTDIVSAQKVGELVRAWHSDYSTDPLLSDTMTKLPTLDSAAGTVTAIAYEEIDGIDTYLKGDAYKPSSLLDANGVPVDDQKFVVFFAGGDVPRIVVGIAACSEIDLDGEGAGTVTALGAALEDITTVEENYDGYPKGEEGEAHENSGPIAYVE